jgi:prefoldin subunit 5
MEMTKSFTLITGPFKAEDARSIIQNLYNQKILYHNRQLLQLRECMNGDIVEVEQKITELENTRRAIVEFLSAPGNDLLVQVTGEIQISFNLPDNE